MVSISCPAAAWCSSPGACSPAHRAHFQPSASVPGSSTAAACHSRGPSLAAVLLDGSWCAQRLHLGLPVHRGVKSCCLLPLRLCCSQAGHHPLCRDAQVMQRALDTHDRTLRLLLSRYFGFEVTTEGDSFTMAFHDPIDAVRFAVLATLGCFQASVTQLSPAAAQVCYCLHVQQRLLREEWPIRLAEHSMARTVTVGSLDGRGHEGQVLFNGLRVRMVINTGKQQGRACQPGGIPSRPLMSSTKRPHRTAGCAMQLCLQAPVRLAFPPGSLLTAQLPCIPPCRRAQQGQEPQCDQTGGVCG